MRIVAAFLTLLSIAHAQTLKDLRRRIDNTHPVVVQVHLALCDNTVIQCGGHGLGDGANLRTNLYWATSEGLRGWLEEQHTGWHLVADNPVNEDVLVRSIWHRTTPVEAYLVIDVWRGTSPAIDRATVAFAGDLYDSTARMVSAAGVDIEAGGAAQVIAWVGHNRWMDYRSFPWERWAKRSTATKGVIAIACYSDDYLRGPIVRGGHLSLTLTRDFVMASGAPLVGALDALFARGDLELIRQRATAAYAKGQGKDPAKLRRVFSTARAGAP